MCFISLVRILHTLVSNWGSRRLLALVIGGAGFLTAVCISEAQTPLASDPVGISSNSCLSNSDTFVSVPFTRPPEFIGLIQAISGNVITVIGAPGWTTNQFVYVAGSQPKHYYALIGPSSTTDPKEGHIYTVVASGSNTLSVDITRDDLTGIPVNTRIVLIPYWTPATLFPASDQNVSFTPTTSTSSYKTQIQIPNYVMPGTNLPVSPLSVFSNNVNATLINAGYSPVYFFSNNVDGTSNNVGWRVVGDNTTDHGDDPLVPYSYFLVRNANAAPTLPLTSLGAVLAKKLRVPLVTTLGGQQDNPVSIIRPFNVPLDAIGLGPADSSFLANDQLLLFDNTQVAFDKAPSATYYYDTTVGNSGGWRLTGDTSNDRGNEVIPAGSGFVIRKAVTANGQTVSWTNSWPVVAVSAVSRKTHGSAGMFDVNLPLTGTLGIECRKGQGGNSDQHQVIVTFPTLVSFGGAVVTSGTASVASTSGNGTTTITVNLTGVTNAQWLTLMLLNVSDGSASNDVAIPMGFLLADVNSSRRTDSGDVTIVRAQTVQPTTQSNCRYDVNVSGRIDSGDVTVTRNQTVTALPSRP